MPSGHRSGSWLRKQAHALAQARVGDRSVLKLKFYVRHAKAMTGQAPSDTRLGLAGDADDEHETQPTAMRP